MPEQRMPYDFSDFTRLMSEFQIPGVDWQELMESQKRNMAALAQANQLLFEGAQAVMQRQLEILRRALAEAVEASRDLMREGDPQANATKRFELAKTSFEAALSNMRELAELASKSNREALEVINKRALESFEEIQRAVQARSRGTR